MTNASYKIDTSRKNDLAKIHIAKKDLGLDDDAYRQIIRDIGKADSGSASDLSLTGRGKVIGHFKSKGWKAKHTGMKRKPKINRDNEVMANADQVALIRHIWICMAEAGVVKTIDESALCTWVRSTTRRYHPQRAGYSALEFLPKWVAIEVTEQLKKWASRCNVKWL